MLRPAEQMREKDPTPSSQLLTFKQGARNNLARSEVSGNLLYEINVDPGVRILKPVTSPSNGPIRRVFAFAKSIPTQDGE